MFAGQLVVVAGRAFRTITPKDVRQVAWFDSRLKAAGVAGHEVAPLGVSAEMYFADLARRTQQGDHWPELVAAVLYPAGMDLAEWTPGTAYEMELFLRALTTREDELLALELLAQIFNALAEHAQLGRAECDAGEIRAFHDFWRTAP